MRVVQGDVLDPSKDPPVRTPVKKGGARDDGPEVGREMGDALRSVYDRTVQEAVPDDLLDLLSKLD